MRTSWIKGLTKETDPRVANLARKISKGKRRYHQQKTSHIGELTKKEQQILYGSILGDGCLIMHKSCINVCYSEGHSLKQKSYVLWKYHQLTRLGAKYNIHDTEGFIGKHKEILLRLPCLPHLTALRHIFYPENIKILPPNIINQLTPLGLAVWYMDDGCKGNYGRSARLSVDCYKFNNIKECVNIIWDNFNIKANIHSINSKHQGHFYQIYFPKKEAQKLWNIIEPYIIDSMKYKLGE